MLQAVVTADLYMHLLTHARDSLQYRLELQRTSLGGVSPCGLSLGLSPGVPRTPPFLPLVGSGCFTSGEVSPPWTSSSLACNLARACIWRNPQGSVASKRLACCFFRDGQSWLSGAGRPLHHSWFWRLLGRPFHHSWFWRLLNPIFLSILFVSFDGSQRFSDFVMNC